MKKLSYFLVLNLLVLTLSAQIQVKQNTATKGVIGSVKIGSVFLYELSFNTENPKEADTVYTLAFKDGQMQNRVDLVSIEHKGALGDLYNLFLNQIKAPVKSVLEVKIGKSDIRIETRKGVNGNTIYVNKGSSFFTIDEKNLNRLFAVSK